MLERRLAINERRTCRLEQQIAQQRTVIAALEAVQRGNSETAENVRDFLRTTEENLRRETIEHRRLCGQLRRESHQQRERRQNSR